MATLEEKEQLMQVLKWTPRTYKISMWGYGGEKVMGTVDRKIYDYFKHRRLDLSDYAWDSDYADEHEIPEDMQPFPPGSWYECDDMAHAHGVSRNAGTLQIEDENGEVIYSDKFTDKTFDKKFVFPASQDVNKLTFIINTEKGSYKEIFDVAVKTNTVSEVSVTKK